MRFLAWLKRTCNRGLSRQLKPSGLNPRGPDWQFLCGHGKVEGKLTVVVLGVNWDLPGSPMCQACTEKYFNEYSTMCDACGKPILPGMLVGSAADGSPHPYTHFTVQCSPLPGLLCGIWGQGKLVQPDYDKHSGKNVASLR